MRLQLEEDDDAGIALAPLIDIVFLLLIFFLAGSVMEKPRREVAISVPKLPSAIIRPTEGQTRIITINRKGQFFVDGQIASRSELLAILDVFALAPSSNRLRLDVDQHASVKYLAEILEALRQRKITNFGLRSAGK